MTILRTERLLLRRARPDDVPAFHAILSDPRAMLYWSTPPHATLEETRIWVTGMAEDSPEEREDFVVELDGRVIGKAGCYRLPEIGYILHPEAQGQGHATEAAQALLGFAFGQVRLHRVYARCDARNAASAKVMARLGMREEAHLHEHAFVKGRWDEELIFSILDRDWSGAAA